MRGSCGSCRYFKDADPATTASGTILLLDVTSVRGRVTERVPFTGVGSGARGPAIGARFAVKTRTREYILGEVEATFEPNGWVPKAQWVPELRKACKVDAAPGDETYDNEKGSRSSMLAVFESEDGFRGTHAEV